MEKFPRDLTDGIGTLFQGCHLFCLFKIVCQKIDGLAIFKVDENVIFLGLF